MRIPDHQRHDNQFPKAAYNQRFEHKIEQKLNGQCFVVLIAAAVRQTTTTTTTPMKLKTAYK
jgi:hypothetical protein